MSNSEAMEKVKKGYRLEKPEKCPEGVYLIMKASWRTEKKHRPSFAVKIVTLLVTIWNQNNNFILKNRKYLQC